MSWEEIFDDTINVLLDTLSSLGQKETYTDIDILVKRLQSFSGINWVQVRLFLFEYGKVLHTFNPGLHWLQCMLDQEIRRMYRDCVLLRPSASEIASVHVAQGENSNKEGDKN